MTSTGWQSNLGLTTIDLTNAIIDTPDGILISESGTIGTATIHSTLDYTDPVLKVNPNLTVTTVIVPNMLLSTNTLENTVLDTDLILKTYGTGRVLLTADPILALQASTKQYTDGIGALYLPLAGGTMLGFQTLYLNPTNALHSTTKQYCDNKIYRAGDTMAGLLTLSGAPTLALHACTKTYCDLKLLLTGGSLSNFLTLHSNPTSALHAVTKQYSDLKLPLTGGTITGDLSIVGLLQTTGTSASFRNVGGLNGLNISYSGNNPILGIGSTSSSNNYITSSASATGNLTIAHQTNLAVTQNEIYMHSDGGTPTSAYTRFISSGYCLYLTPTFTVKTVASSEMLTIQKSGNDTMFIISAVYGAGGNNVYLRLCANAAGDPSVQLQAYGSGVLNEGELAISIKGPGGVLTDTFRQRYNYFRPTVNNFVDLGISANRWKNMYLEGTIFNGSNTATVPFIDINSVATNLGYSKLSFSGAGTQRGYVQYRNNADSTLADLTIGSAGYIRLVSVKGVKLPNFATVDLPTVPDTGAILYNITTGTPQFYNGSSWSNIGANKMSVSVDCFQKVNAITSSVSLFGIGGATSMSTWITPYACTIQGLAFCVKKTSFSYVWEVRIKKNGSTIADTLSYATGDWSGTGMQSGERKQTKVVDIDLVSGDTIALDIRAISAPGSEIQDCAISLGVLYT